ncbi:acetyl-CoA carboxylase biotin carboxyl carrier protein [Alkalicella caledoniensis]|uniref:Biotin carboxyl carrier protein of acetyl-CoA carboxylase n=1 Tax=Alkalicella caledoniensis TaxID=2731377 RepID=A0A7G9WAF5_ALKCA|nr:acetyl-CoA carboxylase biotin carboxyl carrier protein [Alkalicella caledoniensis]QNO15667.1 acetyl-CoA carboxylase biotin carboxyl carrier protein [Alkalicella caledoniensis]
MKSEEILKIIEALGKTDLTEFSLEQKDFVLKMGKGTTQVIREAEIVRQAPTTIESVASQPVPAEPQKVEILAKAEESQDNLIKVTSPMVGTYYQSPSPEAPAFVKVGDSIEKGDVLCIIEAMKLMNEIEASEKGKIVKVLVENGELVEYGQTLFLIEPF